MPTATGYQTQLARYASLRYPGTLKWLLLSPEYQTWRQAPPQALLLTGAPGAGKSVAAAAVVQDLHHRLGEQTDGRKVGIAYIFFDSLRQEEQTFGNLVQCITQQLAWAALETPGSPAGSEHSEGSGSWPGSLGVDSTGSQPDEETILWYLSWRLGQKIARHSAVFIVLDAIDECLEQIPSLHVLITSRTGPDPGMPGWFETAANVQVRSHDPDQKTCVSAALTPPPGFPYAAIDAGSREYLVSAVVEAAHGSFLLGRLYSELLVLAASSGDETLGAIRSAPAPVGPEDAEGYDDVYSRVMEHIALQAPQRASLAALCLLWLAHAAWPLPVHELLAAITISAQESGASRVDGSFDVGSFISSIIGGPNGPDIRLFAASVEASCCGLVCLDWINGVPCLRLRHQTARDFLRRRLQRAEDDLGRVCVSCLRSTGESGPCATDEALAERIQSTPLYGYAARHWARHIRGISAPLSEDNIRYFLDNRGIWESALQAAEALMGMGKQLPGANSQGFQERSSVLNYVVRAGATNVAVAMLSQHPRPAVATGRDGSGRTLLSYAARAGDGEVVTLLLKDPRVDVDTRDNKGRTPLSLAAEAGHAAVVTQFLQYGATPSLRDLRESSPLWYAAEGGHAAVVTALLECTKPIGVGRKAASRSTEGSTDTPLTVALRMGFRDVAELLARAEDVDPHMQIATHDTDDPDNPMWTTPVRMAIRGGYEDVALTLLQKVAVGRDVPPYDRGSTFLVLAAAAGSTRLVEALLQDSKHRLNVNWHYHDGFGWNDVDSDLDQNDVEGELDWIDSDGDSDPDQNYTETELGRNNVENDLDQDDVESDLVRNYFESHLDDGNTVDSDVRRDDVESDFNGRTALMAAAMRGRKAVVRLLLDAEGILPDETTDNGKTALSFAAQEGFRDVVHMLVADPRVEANHRDFDGCTPLSLAAEGGRVAIVDELLLWTRDVNPDSRDYEGRTPLILAVNEYAGTGPHADVARRLLASDRVDPNAEDDEGRTSMFYAAKSGNLPLVEAILARPEADPDRGGNYRPIVAVASEGHLHVAEALLRTGRVDVNATGTATRSSVGWSGNLRLEGTALSIAAAKGHAAMVERLLAVGAVDPNARDGQGRTPLCAAVDGPRDSLGDVVRVLLRAESVDLDATDPKGRTALSLAAEGGRTELVDMLATAGANTDSRDVAGRSPLSWAVAPQTGREGESYRYDETDNRKYVVRQLLRLPAVSPNSEDDEGRTPLIHAALASHSSEFIELLLERDDLDVHHQGRDGRSASDIARDRGDTISVSLLHARGALVEVPPLTEQPLTRVPYVPNHGQMKHELMPPCPYPAPNAPPELARRNVFLPLGQQEEILDPADINGGSLCTTCEAINLDEAFTRRYTDNGGREIVNLGKVDASWETMACPMCRLIAAARPRPFALAKGQPLTPVDDKEHRLVAFSSTYHWLCDGGSYLWGGFEAPWTDTMMIGVVAGRLEPLDGQSQILHSGFIGRLGSNCPENKQAITVPRLPRGDIDLQTAKGWIACCRDSHPRCNPLRLPKVPHFFLVECASGKIVQAGTPAPPYAALSYVWGPPPSEAVSTGQRSLELPAEGQLEPVIQDAIRVTVGLGYGHLWVDRYCIDQSSDAAVKHEQLRSMNLVYANAEVTLVAAAGRDPSSGLPGAHGGRPRKAQPCARIKGHALVCIPPDPAVQVGSSTWATRGWTFQEGVLARRRLFFSEGEMSYECANLLCREAIRVPTGVRRRMAEDRVRLMASSSWMYNHQGQKGRSTLSGSSRELFDLLAEYTARQLTYQSDVLNAMLGIFQVFAKREQEAMYHICGVPVLAPTDADDANILTGPKPLERFISGLCWSLKQPAHRRHGFPSWSWTGWDGATRGGMGGPGRTSFGHGFSVDVSLVLADGTVLGWDECYDCLRRGDSGEGPSDLYLAQNLVLEVTAYVVTARFREERLDIFGWTGTVCAGEGVWEGGFLPTRKECSSALPMDLAKVDEDVGPGMRRRLLDESWLGIVLSNDVSAGSVDANVKYMKVLIVEETHPPGAPTGGCWERIGILEFEHSTLVGSMFERRTLRLV